MKNRNLFLFLIEINNMHCTRHILPIPRTCIWRRCGISWHWVQVNDQFSSWSNAISGIPQVSFSFINNLCLFSDVSADVTVNGSS